MSSQPAGVEDRAAAGVNYPPVRPRASWRVADVEALPDWRLRVRHNDGVTGTVDMAGLVHSPRAGMFAALRDPILFAQVFLDLGAVIWPGEIGLAPDAMHDAIAAKGEWVLG